MAHQVAAQRGVHRSRDVLLVGGKNVRAPKIGRFSLRPRGVVARLEAWRLPLLAARHMAALSVIG
jgi:hypothetical protein